MPTEGLTLISATPSAYARVNRIALLEKSIPFTLQNEVPWNSAETKTPEFNPLEKLPILLLEDGSSIYDSSLIQEYIILRLFGQGPNLLPEEFVDVIKARQIQVLAQGQMDAMALAFFEKNRQVASPEWQARQTRKVEGAMKAYNSYVQAAKVSDWLVADTYTIADIAVGCAIAWVDFFGLMKEPEEWRTTYPDLKNWYEKLSVRESFRQTEAIMFEMKDKVV